MKIAIMQPYLFPYIGYFQLINSVDYFGIGDAVQFINKGWINRNNLLSNGKPLMFSFSVEKNEYKKAIKERRFHDNFGYELKKFKRTLEFNYKKAPYYSETMNILESIFNYEERNVSLFIENQLKIICNYLTIKVNFLNSSLWQIENEDNLLLQERVITKLRKLDNLKVDHFINPCGGKQLYHKDFFIKNGFKLNFLQSDEQNYKQFNHDFVPNLSIIDVLMFNSVEEIKLLLKKCTLV